MIEIYKEIKERGSSIIRASIIDLNLEGPGLVVKTSNQESTNKTIANIPEVKLVQIDLLTAKIAVKPKRKISNISNPTQAMSQL